MKKFTLAPALAALAMFLFGFLFWGVSTLPYKVLGRTADDDAAGLALGKIFPATGTYLIPGPYLGEKTVDSLTRRGPSAQVYFVKEGSPAMDAAVFVKGYVHYFVVALLLAMFLHKASPAFKCFACPVRFSAAIGLIAALLINFSDPIWWHHPWGWHLVCAIYNVLELTLAGLVLAKFVLPPRTVPLAATG